MLITDAILKQIVPQLTAQRAKEIAELINLVCPTYGINNKNLLEEFLATVIHESCGFTAKLESINYTTAARIIATWPSRFNTTGTGGKKNANDYVRNPKKLANEVYNGRMGNRTGTDDGYNFRGGGFIQITGRDAYASYARYHGIGVEDAANKVKAEDWWAMDSACWVFTAMKGLLPYADKDDFLTITKRINGGTIGWNDRVYYYERCKKYLK